jgi:hypothetical protein
MLASEVWPDVAATLNRVDEAEEAAERRRERQREYDAEWATDRYASGHAASWSAPQFDHDHSVSRGSSLGP